MAGYEEADWEGYNLTVARLRAEEAERSHDRQRAARGNDGRVDWQGYNLTVERQRAEAAERAHDARRRRSD